MTLTSQVLITSQLENTLLELETLRKDEQIIEIYSKSFATKLMQGKEEELSNPKVHRIAGEKQSFTLADAKVVISKAYLASEEKMVIILVADHFSTYVQNSLLKVIEEPPKNKIFIFLTESKSAILPTIKSRLPISILSEVKEEKELGLDMKYLSLESVYEFTQIHERTDAKAMKLLIEEISKEAIRSEGYDLDEKTLSLFSNTFIALDVGSPPSFVLNTLLLKLLARKKR
ncbi:MAG: DNA polymerase III subunit delta' [Epsilonproteobacteria bacterium]|nr:MAG: DNA polymerase III subunit delta' [Campylobacterota bacterium]